MLRSNPRLPISVAAFPVAAFLYCAASFAQTLPIASRPEDVGFSSKRLETTREVLKGGR